MEDAILRRHRFLPKESGGKEGPKRGISILPLFGISPFKNDQSGGPRPPYWRHPPGPCSRAGAHPGKLAVPPGVPRIELGGVPVPLAEAVTAGNGAHTGRKDERRRLPFACAPCHGPRKSPFFFGIQNRFFFKGEKEMGLAPGGRCPPRWGSVTARLKGDFLFRRPAHQVI